MIYERNRMSPIMTGCRSIPFYVAAIMMATTYAVAQDPSQRTLRQADSLKQVWDVLWRRSDSLRVEAMIARMKSDSLRRNPVKANGGDAASDSAIVDDLRRQAALRTAQLKLGSGKVAAGQTVSDTLSKIGMTRDAETGQASYYAEKFHGRRTSSGEDYDMDDYTCAHRWLPFGTKVCVTNLRNGKRVVVRVNDRGPWKHERLIDVSKQAAKDLDMIRHGTTTVRLDVVDDDAETGTIEEP